MIFWMRLKWYYFKISWGLIGYKDRKRSIREIKDKVKEFIGLRPDVTMYLIYKNIGLPRDVIKKYALRGMSDFLILVKMMRPHEWAIIVLGLLLAAWLIYAAFGGTIG